MSLRRLTDRENALLFVCSLIEYIGRATLNDRTTVVNTLGREVIENLYEFSDVYHCDQLCNVWCEIQERYNIQLPRGTFDNVTECMNAGYRVPGEFEIGRVFMYLIDRVCTKQNKEPIDALIEVYNNGVCDDISYYCSAAYYSVTEEQYDRFVTGKWWE